MCRKLFLLVFAALLLALPAVSSASLLSNRGFEEGTWTSESSIPDDWWKWTSGGCGSWKNNAGQAHSGSKFVCVGGNNSSQYAVFGEDVFDMRAGAIYQFDAWVKTENWGSPTAKLRVEFKNSDNYVIATDELTLFTGQKSTWEQYTFTTDLSPVGTVQANFVCYGHGQGSVWFDDTYAVPAPVAEGPDLLLNSSFEDGEWVNELSMPDHWRKWSGNWGWAAWKNDPYEAHSGSKSFALGGNNSSEYAVIGHDVTGLSAGEIYIFSVWAKAESIWWGNPTAKLAVEFKNSNNQIIRTDELTLFTGRNITWEWYNLVTDPVPTGTIQANFVCKGIGEGTIWFDDVKATVYEREKARNPNPAGGEENVDKDVVLKWVAGNSAVTHDVYFGTTYDGVNNANTSSSEFKGNQSFDNDTYDPPGVLELSKTYYWRIDEKNGSTCKGNVWSFTVTHLDVVHINQAHTYQTMSGFGAHFTDSSAYLMTNRMTESQRQAAMYDLFDPDTGIGLSYLRQPIGASDFRLQDYTYDDMRAGETDYGLSNFSIAYDEDYIIPMLQQASSINPDVKIIGSPWSAPAWMKTTESLYSGALIDSDAIYDTYAEYFVRYVQAYENHNLELDAVTLQNEPGRTYGYPGMEMTSDNYARLVKALGPKFDANGIDTKIFLYDWSWSGTDYPLDILNDADARAWVTGTAFHGYSGYPEQQSIVKDAYPDKHIYFTELTGVLNACFADDLMRFTSLLTIRSIRNWAETIVFWNIALDETGGPKLGGGCECCRGVITVDSSTGDVTKNADYYCLGHVSKFVNPGAVRIGSSETAENVGNVAFENPDGSIAVVVLNENTGPRDFRMEWDGQAFETALPGRSVTTFTWPHQTNATVSVWTTTADKQKLLEQQSDLQFHRTRDGLCFIYLLLL